jgi:hypothetical protein
MTANELNAESARALAAEVSEILDKPNATRTYTDVIAMQQRLIAHAFARIEALEAAANAKIERALAIPEESYYENMPPSAAMVAANDMREQFREVLTSTP